MNRHPSTGPPEDAEAPAAPSGTGAESLPRPAWRLWLRRLGPFGAASLVAVLLPGLGVLLLLEELQQWAGWLQDHQPWTALAFILFMAPAAAFAILPTHGLSVVSGWAFSFSGGLVVVLLAILLAAAMTYRAWNWVGGDGVMQALRSQPRWRAVHGALLGSGFGRALLIVTLIRLPPQMPFAFASVAMAAMRVPHGPYLLGTLLGMGPRAALVVFLGASLTELDLQRPTDAWVTLVFAALAVAALVGLALVAGPLLRRVLRDEPSAPAASKEG